MLNSKKYCNFYKKLLVEEMIFIENFFEYHYGNCAVIGRIIKKDDCYFLENIRLNCLGKEHELPEGSIKIRLLTNLYKDIIPNGKVVEIYGNAVIYNTRLPHKNYLPNSLQDIFSQFNEFLNLEETLEKDLDMDSLKKIFNQSLLEKYEPAIQIRFINLCDQPEELIAYNLEIRLLSEQKC